MLWIEFYGVCANGSPAETVVGQSPFSNLGAAIDEALRLRDGTTREILARLIGFRIRNEFRTVIYEFTF